MTTATVPPVPGRTSRARIRPRSATLAGYLALTAGELALLAGVGVVVNDVIVQLHVHGHAPVPLSVIHSALRGLLVVAATGLGIALAWLVLLGRRHARVPLMLCALLGAAGAVERAHHYWVVDEHQLSTSWVALGVVACELVVSAILLWTPATGRWLRTSGGAVGPTSGVSRRVVNRPRLSYTDAIVVSVVGGAFWLLGWAMFLSGVVGSVTNESSVGGPMELAGAFMGAVATLPTFVMVVAGAEAMHRAGPRGDQNRG